MKRPAALRKPATSQSEKKKPKLEEEVSQEPEEVEKEKEQEEEEGKKEKNGVGKPAALTKKALEDHQAFLQEASKLSDKEFQEALGKLPGKQQQCLWKKFEASRKSSGWEEKYKQETTGAGSMVRKKNLLRSWCLDGGKCSEMYKKAFASISLERSHGVEKEWISKKKMEEELGLEEMKARIEAGTLKWRRNPEDVRFFQFQKLSEKEALAVKKSQGATRTASASASLKDMVSFDQLMGEDVDEEDFGFGAEEGSGTEGMDKDLAKALGLKESKGKDNTNKKADKWAELSQVQDGSRAGEIEEKLVKFKTEISKDLASLEGGAFALAKKGGDKGLQKAVKSAKQKAQEVLGELEKLLGKKGAKREVVAVLSKALTTLKECKAVKVKVAKALK